MKKNTLYVLLSLASILCISMYFLSEKKAQPLRKLPYFNPKNYGNKKANTPHSIPPFSFINQYNHTVTEKNTQQKIYVVDFFFTTCQSICPIMSTQMERVYQAYKNKPDFLIISHTVNPETDSVPQLLSYAKKHGVIDSTWLFVTGDKKQLYRMAREGYLLNAEEGDGGKDDFIHTQNFALIDKEKHIRGFYDGTDSTDVTRLLKDIEILFNERASTK
ncbi:MAG: SCO family protein [Bacteroidetes bacterium]|nr:SCO family protein [Bacteroidota bacterium]